MKLLRYSPAGHEKPGVLDAQGRVRDLSGDLPDLASSALLPAALARLGQLKTDAMRHVAGYCVVNDASEREFQIDPSGTWDKGKGCDTFTPLGPWLVTPDEVPNPQALSLRLEVDGKHAQDGRTVQGLGVQTQRVVQA